MSLTHEDRIAMLTGEMSHEYVSGRLSPSVQKNLKGCDSYIANFKEKINRYFKYNKIFSFNHKYTDKELLILSKAEANGILDKAIKNGYSYLYIVRLLKEVEHKCESVLGDRVEETDLIDIVTCKVKFDPSDHCNGIPETVAEQILYSSIEKVSEINK